MASGLSFAQIGRLNLKYAPSEIQALLSLYATTSWVTSNYTNSATLAALYAKQDWVTANFATAVQGAQASVAYSWGNHAGLYATAAQGALADAAYAWGNHALAGYALATAITAARREVFTPPTNPQALAMTPVGEVQIFLTTTPPGTSTLLLHSPTDYTIAGDTITFVIALGATDVVDEFYQA